MSIYLTGFTYKQHDIELDVLKTHLIITGKNGSGKTSLLKEIYENLISISRRDSIFEVDRSSYQYENDIFNKIKILERKIDDIYSYNNQLTTYLKIRNQTEIRLKFNKPLAGGFIEIDENKENDFIITFFDSKRVFSFEKPKGITKLDLNNYGHNEKANKDFIQYLVNLQAEKAFAYQEKDGEAVRTINKWFRNFKENLGKLFETDNVDLKFNRKDFSYTIIIDGQEMDLFKLSDGFASIMYIISEIIMRMKNKWDLLSEGIVIIDEIETHLHVSLQKKILKFLIDFFPNIQFIVSTHSPFVLSSISKSIVYDMEKKEKFSDMSSYSYESLIEDYFEVDQYSFEIKKQFSEYLDLVEKQKEGILDTEESLKIDILTKKISNIPDTQAPEIKYKFYESEIKRRKNRNDNSY